MHPAVKYERKSALLCSSVFRTVVLRNCDGKTVGKLVEFVLNYGVMARLMTGNRNVDLLINVYIKHTVCGV
jgi:hypothetical protein